MRSLTMRAIQSNVTLALLLVLLTSCGGGDAPPAGAGPDGAGSADGADAHDDHADDGPSEKERSIVLNAAGRQSLGLLFETVEQRPRGPLLDFPGSVEPTYDARHIASAPLAGRIELVVLPMETVAEGAVLFRIDAPDWRILQADLAEAEATISGLDAWLGEVETLVLAHRRHEAALSSLEDRWKDRLSQLESIRESAGGQASALVTAQAALLDARARLSEAQEVGARLAVDRAEHVASRESMLARRRSLLARASTLVGKSVEDLSVTTAAGPAWAAVSRIEVRARRGGLVDVLHENDGAWAEAGRAILELRRTDALWVHADVWQADLPKLAASAIVTIRPASGPAGDTRAARATLRPGLTADPREMSAAAIAIFDGGPPAWARPGLAVRVQVEPPEEASSSPAVPLAAIRRDGLERVVWVEDPSNKATLICIPVEVIDEADGWAWIESPIEPGMRVVVRGAGRLSLAVSGSESSGGHMHADGTFHAEDD